MVRFHITFNNTVNVIRKVMKSIRRLYFYFMLIKEFFITQIS